MQYDEDTTFNENNVVQHLAELEEYISLFITYMAYKADNKDANISSLGLENIPAKEFDKPAVHVDAPNSNEIDMNMMGEDMETEDELTTDPKALFRKFEDKYGPQFGNKWQLPF